MFNCTARSFCRYKRSSQPDPVPKVNMTPFYLTKQIFKQMEKSKLIRQISHRRRWRVGFAVLHQEAQRVSHAGSNRSVWGWGGGGGVNVSICPTKASPERINSLKYSVFIRTKIKSFPQNINNKNQAQDSDFYCFYWSASQTMISFLLYRPFKQKRLRTHRSNVSLQAGFYIPLPNLYQRSKTLKLKLALEKN